MLEKRSPIRNFTEGTGLISKILYNTIFYLGAIRFLPINNGLTSRDKERIVETVRKGDIILLGNLRYLSKLLIHNILTHSAVYTGEGGIIHATVHGVKNHTLSETLRQYDTCVILRVPGKNIQREKLIRNFLRQVKNKMDIPYNFLFDNRSDAVFCTKLINDALLNSGYETGLKSVIPKSEKSILLKNIPLHPIMFLEGNFKRILISQNLYFDDSGKLKRTGYRKLTLNRLKTVFTSGLFKSIYIFILNKVRFIHKLPIFSIFFLTI